MQTAAKMADFRAGFLCSASLADATHLVTAFRIGLKEVGFVEGQNDDADCLRERGDPVAHGLVASLSLGHSPRKNPN